MILALAGTGISVLWATIEFLIYLFKDLAFNWNSVHCVGYCFIALIVFFVLDLVFSMKNITQIDVGSSLDPYANKYHRPWHDKTKSN